MWQEKLFKVAGLPMVENCMGGYNSCMFAYGQVSNWFALVLVVPFSWIFYLFNSTCSRCQKCENLYFCDMVEIIWPLVISNDLALLKVIVFACRLEVGRLTPCLVTLRGELEDTVSTVGWHQEFLSTYFLESRRYSLLWVQMQITQPLFKEPFTVG